MSLFLSRHLRVLSITAAVAWTVILIIGVLGLVTSTMTFDDVAYYSASAALGLAILCTTAVMLGVQALASALADEPVRGAGLLGGTAAVLAIAFVWFIPAWLGLFLWALIGTILRAGGTGLTSPRMRIVVLSGLGICAVAVPVTGFLAVTGDVFGAALWGALIVLGAALIAWHVDMATRTRAHTDAPLDEGAPQSD